jgi:hypothetical protein
MLKSGATESSKTADKPAVDSPTELNSVLHLAKIGHGPTHVPESAVDWSIAFLGDSDYGNSAKEIILTAVRDEQNPVINQNELTFRLAGGMFACAMFALNSYDNSTLTEQARTRIVHTAEILRELDVEHAAHTFEDLLNSTNHNLRSATIESLGEFGAHALTSLSALESLSEFVEQKLLEEDSGQTADLQRLRNIIETARNKIIDDFILQADQNTCPVSNTGTLRGLLAWAKREGLEEFAAALVKSVEAIENQ